MAEIQRLCHSNFEQVPELKALKKRIESLRGKGKKHQLGICVVVPCDLTQIENSSLLKMRSLLNNSRNVAKEGITDNQMLRQYSGFRAWVTRNYQTESEKSKKRSKLREASKAKTNKKNSEMFEYFNQLMTNINDSHSKSLVRFAKPPYSLNHVWRSSNF